MTASDNQVHETTTSTGTGNLTLSNVDGRKDFNTAFGTGGTNVFFYFLSHRSTGEREVGKGHLSNSTTLVRDTVLESSNAGSLVNLSAGTIDVTSDYPAAFMSAPKGGDIASASPLVIGSDGSYFDVTGTTGFSAMTVEAGRFFMLQFDGALTITHGSSIDLPGEQNITTAAGDRMICYAEAANTVQCLSYFTADGLSPLGGATLLSTVIYTSNDTWTKADYPGLKFIEVELVGGGGGGGPGAAASSGQASGGVGGSAGGYEHETIQAASLSATESVTVGSGGAGGIGATPAAGSAGGTTSFGSLLQATGGNGGSWIGSGTSLSISFSGASAGVGSGGDISSRGEAGGGVIRLSGSVIASGKGGNSVFGGGASGRTSQGAGAGSSSSRGGGGGGGVSLNAGGAVDGGAGGDGLVIVKHYV